MEANAGIFFVACTLSVSPSRSWWVLNQMMSDAVVSTLRRYFAADWLMRGLLTFRPVLRGCSFCVRVLAQPTCSAQHIWACFMRVQLRESMIKIHRGIGHLVCPIIVEAGDVSAIAFEVQWYPSTLRAEVASRSRGPVTRRRATLNQSQCIFHQQPGFAFPQPQLAVQGKCGSICI